MTEYAAQVGWVMGGGGHRLSLVGLMGTQHAMAIHAGSETLAGVSDPRVVSMVAGIARGESAALAAFYDGWFDRGYDLACSLTRRDEAFCLDVVQEAMLKVIKSLKPSLGIATRRSLDAWFTRVVHTTALDMLRRESRRGKRERTREDGRAGSARDAREAALLEERIAWLAGELALLDREEAGLVAVRFVRDGTLEEAGAAEGMSVGAAHGRVRRLLDRIRKAGKEKFDE